MMQTDLFADNNKKDSSHPLAYRARPVNFAQFKGHLGLFDRYPFLKKNLQALILWGPPGNGKTTMAYLLAKNNGKNLYRFNAVLAGVNDLKKIIQRALEMKRSFGKDPVIFIDEIHRFNKAQQDALLPYVEAGDFILIGATTENPTVAINRSLLSRLQIVEMGQLNTEEIKIILEQACENFNISVDDQILQVIANFSGGDARKALNILEIVDNQKETLCSVAEVKKLVLKNARSFDKSGDRHYDVISAFIKSMRGSDPDAACLWLAVMLDGGEDPVFIARRLVIFSSEDVGNADPMAAILAGSILQTVLKVGMPEARICLAQATTYLACAPKDNASYKAIKHALSYVRERPTLEVPSHLKNHPPLTSVKYKYPPDYPNHFVQQDYAGQKIPRFYRRSPQEEKNESNDGLGNSK